jgi:uncharacterized membrane protein
MSNSRISSADAAMRITRRAVMRVLMAAFYLVAGVLHIVAPAGFVLIVPDAVPWPETTVMVTGLCEIAGAAGLMTKRLRRAAGIALAAYAVCVFPANIKHALFTAPVPPCPPAGGITAPVSRCSLCWSGGRSIART